MQKPTYTHGHDEAVLRSHRWRTAENSAAYLLPHLRPGQRLLDVGAGPGTLTADLAERVAPGPVTAVEIDEAAAALTRRGLAGRGVEGEVVVADAHALPFDDASFDVVHAHQTLQHVADPVQVLRELRRVCAPGGVVAVRDSDYPAFAWFPEVPELDEWLALYLRVAGSDGGQPSAGRRLRSWARAAGFDVATEVTSTSSTWCFSTPDDVAWWGGLWADRVEGTRVGTRAVELGLTDPAGLRRVANGWRRWASEPDAWFSSLHGELLCRR